MRISPKVVQDENIVTMFSGSLIMQQMTEAVMTGDADLGFERFWDLQVEEYVLNQQVSLPGNTNGNCLSVFGRQGDGGVGSK